jgi:cytochrome c peroxidase
MVGPFGTKETVSPAAEAYAVRGAPKLKAAYADWVKAHDAQGGDRHITISLGHWKALSSSYTTAGGVAKLNLIDGTVSVSVTGLPTGEWDVWLVDNKPGPGRSVKPEASDATIRVGRLVRDGDKAKLDAELGAAAFKAFHVDLVVVATADGDPGTAGLLYGSPSLFQRLYTSLRSPALLMAGDFAAQPGIRVERSWASLFGARTAEADDIGIFVDPDVVVNDLIRRGAGLFLNETFRGNGRTCATCHRPEANFAVDPNFIATLPDNDALFVAEFTPALAFNPLGPKFEVPVLMRRHAVIVENVDGMDDLVNRFAMRGVPHTLALNLSLTPSTGDGSSQPPNERTGWSGDGAPGAGTLRDFATGAVTQHFPKRLNRINGTDFVLPNDGQLNAMEAFQRSLGRQAELVLPLALKDARAARGQQLFTLSVANGGAGCNACHANGGANTSFGDRANRNFNTGVENQPDRPVELTLRALGIDLTPGVASNILPRDGGFNTRTGTPPAEGPGGTGIGDGAFNTPVVVEAADSGPFFHDNSIDTIEGAVAFYNSDQFNNSPSGTGINMAATQVEAIAAFLRVINALENIRSASELANAAKRSSERAASGLLKQAITETQDAIGVLFPRALHPPAVKFLDNAADHFRRATSGFGIDRSQIDRGLSDLARARAQMI